MTKTTHRFRNSVATVACLFGMAAGSAVAAPFSSGSTGADGAFAPTQNVMLELPPSGIFNFTTVNIPSGVTVSFKSNAANTPVMMLATGDVVVTGVIDVRGNSAEPMKEPAGSFLQQGALGGPGGYSGGRGGDAGSQPAAPGQGPGGGEGGNSGSCNWNDHPRGGGGGGFAANGGASWCRSYVTSNTKGAGGPAYGSSVMLPLVGGSGGGGGAGALYSTGIPGAGGGGGGGALLIASSGKVTVAGGILAQGGAGGGFGSNCSGWRGWWDGGAGGGGSGGIVRILAQNYQGGGTINVAGGVGGCKDNGAWGGGSGSQGYVSVETPRAGTLSLNGLPSLAISQVGGLAVPQSPTGIGDISLPLTQANPVSVDIVARYIPPGTAIKVVLTPSYSGDVVTVNATPLAGTLESSTASASITVPYGASTLLVQASYTLTLAMGEALSVYAQGERVESILMSAAPGGETQFKLVTISGKEYGISPTVLATVMPS